MKQLIKKVAYHAGVLPALHRFRNRGTLTVAMFHRIVPASDDRHRGADPEWTMTPDTFERCLRFFKRHYHIVSAEQVFAAMRGERMLPGPSLLVTFDDGWADTAEFAQPLLARHGVPALVFVAGCAIDSAAPFWQEHVYSMLAARDGAMAQLDALLGQHGVSAALPDHADEGAIRDAIALLERQAPSLRTLIIGALDTAPVGAPPAMMSQAQLRALRDAGVAIGGHGMEHIPLTKADDLAAELGQAQRCLAHHLGQPVIESMSFPHGAQSPGVIAACKAAGYRYLFSSVPLLVDPRSSQARTGPLGRIHISERALLDAGGRFQPALLATWLFLRPVAAAEGASGG